MLKKAGLLTRPTLARRDAPCLKQGRSFSSDHRFTFQTLRFTVFGSEARTPLADFFSILLGGVTDVSVARDYYRKPCGGVKVNPRRVRCVHLIDWLSSHR